MNDFFSRFTVLMFVLPFRHERIERRTIGPTLLVKDIMSNCKQENLENRQ